MMRSVFLKIRKFPIGSISLPKAHFSLPRQENAPDDEKNALKAHSLINSQPSTRKGRKRILKTENIEPKLIGDRDLVADVRRFQLQMERAIKPMIELNKKHNLQFEAYYENEDTMDIRLVIKTPRGKFQFYAEHPSNTMMFCSYITGWHGYHYYPIENLWLSKKFDQHELVGMITRDMIHHLVGCPDFNYPGEFGVCWCVRMFQCVVVRGRSSVTVKGLIYC